MVTSDNPSSLMVSWQPPPEIGHNGVIIGYVIEYRRDGVSPITVANSGTTRTLSRLAPFVVYFVRVAARTVNGTGTPGSSVSGMSGEDGKFHNKRVTVQNVIVYEYTVKYIYKQHSFLLSSPQCSKITHGGQCYWYHSYLVMDDT